MEKASSILIRFKSHRKKSLSGYLAQKIMSNAIKENKDWIKKMNVSYYQPVWYRNNIRQEHWKNHPKRLFLIKMKKKVSRDDLLLVKQNVGAQINVKVVKENNFVWLSDNSVWEDAIGSNEAYHRMIRLTEEPRPGWYEKYKMVLHEYFREGYLHPQIATGVFAPYFEIAPHYRVHMHYKKGVLHINPERYDVTPDDTSSEHEHDH